MTLVDGLCFHFSYCLSTPNPYFSPLSFSCLCSVSSFYVCCNSVLCPLCVSTYDQFFISHLQEKYLAGSQGGDFHVVSPSLELRHSLTMIVNAISVSFQPPRRVGWPGILVWLAQKAHLRTQGTWFWRGNVPREPLYAWGSITDWPQLPWEMKIPIPLWSELPARVCLNN